ncbi:hypothetical protein BVX97_05780 [bacterium E08(2017)]|nr:hypothetical protein BVX97_05780 [bacterium E08(2017)]
MVREKDTNTTRLVGLRTKYFPKNRIGHGLVSSAPWIDILFLFMCFFILESKFMLQPGVVIDLPTTSFKGTVATDMIAVIRAVDSGNGTMKEIIFFDDERFLVDNELQMKKLKQLFNEAVVEDKAAGLLIYSDKNVKQGTLVELFNMVKEVGVVRINIASREDIQQEE